MKYFIFIFAFLFGVNLFAGTSDAHANFHTRTFVNDQMLKGSNFVKATIDDKASFALMQFVIMMYMYLDKKIKKDQLRKEFKKYIQETHARIKSMEKCKKMFFAIESTGVLNGITKIDQKFKKIISKMQALDKRGYPKCEL